MNKQPGTATNNQQQPGATRRDASQTTPVLKFYRYFGSSLDPFWLRFGDHFRPFGLDFGSVSAKFGYIFGFLGNFLKAAHFPLTRRGSAALAGMLVPAGHGKGLVPTATRDAWRQSGGIKAALARRWRQCGGLGGSVAA